METVGRYQVHCTVCPFSGHNTVPAALGSRSHQQALLSKLGNDEFDEREDKDYAYADSKTLNLTGLKGTMKLSGWGTEDILEQAQMMSHCLLAGRKEAAMPVMNGDMFVLILHEAIHLEPARPAIDTHIGTVSQH